MVYSVYVLLYVYTSDINYIFSTLDRYNYDKDL